MPNTTIQTLENLHKLIVSQIDAIPYDIDDDIIYRQVQRQVYNEVANLIEEQILKESENRYWIDPVIERRYILPQPETVQELLNEINTFYADIKEFAKERQLFCNDSKDGRYILSYISGMTPNNMYSFFCRGLVLAGNPKNYKIIAKGFNRFYNLQESVSIENGGVNIDWTKPFEVQFKYDGSLILVYKKNGKVYVNTRNGYANGSDNLFHIEEGTTWESLFLSTNPDLSNMREGETYIYELCSPHNQVVELYENTFSVLLGIIKTDGTELQGVFAGKTYSCNNLEEVMELLKTLKPEQEGFVIAQWDNNKQIYNRVKCKTQTWKRLSILSQQCNWSEKGIMKLVLEGEADEAVALFPEKSIYIEEKKKLVDRYIKRIEEVYGLYKDIAEQRDFVLAVKEYPFNTLLIDMRKRNGEINKENFDKWIMRWGMKKETILECLT